MDIPQRPCSRRVASRPYLVAPHLKAELWWQIESLLKAGIIRESHSFYSSPVLFAPKKDGKLRLCIDYRSLNQQTERDPFLTPVVADLIASTRGARMFSKLDLQVGSISCGRKIVIRKRLHSVHRLGCLNGLRARSD